MATNLNAARVICCYLKSGGRFIDDIRPAKLTTTFADGDALSIGLRPNK